MLEGCRRGDRRVHPYAADEAANKEQGAYKQCLCGCIAGTKKFVGTVTGKIVMGIGIFFILSLLTQYVSQYVMQKVSPSPCSANDELAQALKTAQESLSTCVAQCPASQNMLQNITAILSQLGETLREEAALANGRVTQFLDALAANVTALASDQSSLKKYVEAHLPSISANASAAAAYARQVYDSLTSFNCTQIAQQCYESLAANASSAAEFSKKCYDYVVTHIPGINATIQAGNEALREKIADLAVDLYQNLTCLRNTRCDSGYYCDPNNYCL